MPRYLVTPSLYSSWSYYRSAEHTGKEDLLKTLRKVREPPSENMLLGIQLEEDVIRLARGQRVVNESEQWINCCMEIADEVRGGLFQEKLYTDMRVGDWDVLLYGKADCVRRDFGKDIKFTKSYDLGKYSDSIQHDLYMFCGGLPRFRYLVCNGNSVFHEDYHQTPKSVGIMKARIYEMLCDVLADADFRTAFIANWTSRT